MPLLIKHFYPALLLSILFFTSCNNLNNADGADESVDTMSVKKLSADSSSDMPVAQPKDSSKDMPNPFDPKEKN
jgi:hypothetical protein